jgi:mRNA-degrading endonuclease RelE of RelBE toxin-antitoxin system
MNQFTLQISDEVERQLRQCRVSFRASIRKRLQAIAQDAAKPKVRKQSPVAKGPPLRFYVSEGYRVSYQVNPKTRTVVVLELRAEST